MKYDCHVKFKSLPLGTCQKQAGIWQSPIWLVFQRLAWHKSNIAHAIFVVEKRRTLHCIHTDWKTSRPTTASNLYTANQGRWHTLWGGSVLVVAASSHVRKSTGPQKRFVQICENDESRTNQNIFKSNCAALCHFVNANSHCELWDLRWFGTYAGHFMQKLGHGTSSQWDTRLPLSAMHMCGDANDARFALVERNKVLDCCWTIWSNWHCFLCICFLRLVLHVTEHWWPTLGVTCKNLVQRWWHKNRIHIPKRLDFTKRISKTGLCTSKARRRPAMYWNALRVLLECLFAFFLAVVCEHKQCKKGTKSSKLYQFG